MTEIIENILTTHYNATIFMFIPENEYELYINNWKFYYAYKNNINRIQCKFTTSQKDIIGHLDWNMESNSYVISDEVSNSLDLVKGTIYVNTLPKGETEHTNYRKIVDTCLEVDDFALWLFRQYIQANNE